MRNPNAAAKTNVYKIRPDDLDDLKNRNSKIDQSHKKREIR